MEALTGVGKTALGVATVRALESRRADRLFDDPYAQAFVDAAPGAFPDAPRTGLPDKALASLGEVFSFHGVIRTRFFDDYLIDACAAGCRQVVLLAAGLDTRPFRLAWPEDVRVFELDLPDVLAFKDEVLTGQAAAAKCERIVVPADLRDDWAGALVAAGFRSGEPAAWLAEGLLLYLSADEAARLLTAVGELAAPGSRFSSEHGPMADSPLLSQARAMPAMEQFTALWKGGLGDDMPDWLARHGWRAQFHDRDELAAAYGRRAPESSRGGFLTATRVVTTG